MNSWCGGAVIYHVRNFQKVKSVLPKVRNVCLKLTNHLSTNIKSVILCSGQGAQYVGMLKKTLSGKHASKVYQLSELANDVLGYDLLSICLNGPNDVLQKTVHCQPATLLASLVAAEVLKQDQPDIFSQVLENHYCFCWQCLANVRDHFSLCWQCPANSITFITTHKGPVKLIKRVKIAHSFLRSVSNQFHVIILSLPMYFYKWLSKIFLKTTSKNGEMSRFNRSLLIQSF